MIKISGDVRLAEMPALLTFVKDITETAHGKARQVRTEALDGWAHVTNYGAGSTTYKITNPIRNAQDGLDELKRSGIPGVAEAAAKADSIGVEPSVRRSGGLAPEFVSALDDLDDAIAAPRATLERAFFERVMSSGDESRRVAPGSS